MRITGRQLRQIIKEEVARMMNEEEIEFTEPAVVKPQGTGLIPTGILKRSGQVITDLLIMNFTKTAMAFGPDAVGEAAIDISAGDQIDVSAELYQLDTMAILGGRVNMVMPKIAIKSITVNGQAQPVEQKIFTMTAADLADFKAAMQGEPRQASGMKPSERTQLTVSFTATPELVSRLDVVLGTPLSDPDRKGDISLVRSTLSKLVQASIKAVG
jgi:hypothetical protein